MATLHLRAFPAHMSAPGMVGYYPFQDAFPAEQVPFRTAKEAESAFEAYAEKVRSSGAVAHVAGMLGKERAPAGFRQLHLRRFVNL
jgi:hypothetical protein